MGPQWMFDCSHCTDPKLKSFTSIFMNTHQIFPRISFRFGFSHLNYKRKASDQCKRQCTRHGVERLRLFIVSLTLTSYLNVI